jgi:septal ring factor EnvC (AmiA/AmiB activator)/DNA-directed RNA polymerase subunit RPC12/RpoP
MNCIRCGRTISENALLCPECGGRRSEAQPQGGKASVGLLTAEMPNPSRGGKFARKKKKAEAPDVQKKLIRALVAVSVLCVLFAVFSGTCVYYYFNGYLVARNQLRSQQAAVEEQAADYEGAKLTLQSVQAQLETAKGTIDAQNKQIAQLESDLNTTLGTSSQAQADGKLLEQQNETLKQENQTLSDQLSEQKTKYDTLAAENTALAADNSAYLSQIDSLKSQANTLTARTGFFDRNIGFVCTSDPTHYHCYGCSYLTLTGAWKVIRLYTAAAGSYSACPYCGG